MLMIRIGNRSIDGRTEDLHVPGEDDQVDLRRVEHTPHLLLLRLLAAGLDGEVHELDTEVPAELGMIVVVGDNEP